MDRKILLIEDDPELAEQISHILGLAQYQVVHVRNGVEGVEKAIKILPDLIISEVLIPELNGYGVIQVLSHNEKTKGIPIIFISKKVSKEDIRTGMNFGADDYITQPFEVGDLLRAVEVRLQKRCASKVNTEEKSKSLSEKDVDFGPDGIQHFLENKPIKVIKKRDLIFMEGQSPGNLYWIKSGKVKNFRTNSFGKELITSIQGEGEFLGYLPLLKNSHYEESAEALEEVKLQTIPKAEFLSLLHSNHEFCLKLIELLSRELVEMEERMIDLAYQPVRQRVARILLYLGSQFEDWENSSTIHMSRKDISSIIGTAPETLNRMLAEFREEGLIDTNDNGLIIKDKRRLTKVAKT
jgi:CRP-like cAMP-binding protein/CheY-like chemotaxis protein